MPTTLEQSLLRTNVLFNGSYANPITPLWASAATGASIGPNIQVSTIAVNAVQGAVILNAQGTLAALESAALVFNKTTDASETLSQIGMTVNQVQGGGQQENISIVNQTGVFYDDLALGRLLVYGDTTTTNPSGQVAIIGQYGTSTDSQITTTGLHLSSLFVSTINGVSPGGGGSAGPDILVSTIGVAALGHIELTASGSAALPNFSYIQFDNTPDKGGSSVLANQTNIYPAQPLGIESLAVTDPIGNLYKPFAVGNLNIFGTISSTTQQTPPIATFKQGGTNTNLEVITTGLYTSSLLCSSINGQIPGGGGAYNPNLQLSTLELYSSGTITLDCSGSILTGAQAAQILFKKTSDQVLSTTILAMSRNNLGGAFGTTSVENLTVFNTIGGKNYDTLTTGNLLLYGLTNVNNISKGQIGLIQQWSTTQDVELLTTGFHTSSIISQKALFLEASISTLKVSTIQDYIVQTSSIVSQNISTAAGQFGAATAGAFSTNTASIIKAITSSLSFNASLGGVNLGGVDLGMGGYLGGLTGQLVTGATSMTIAGAALATGAAALLTSRTASNVYLPGQNSNSFNVINSQTQLQFSTLGNNVSSFLRFTSSMAGSDPSVSPAPENIVFTTIPAGTPCVRSMSDPLNPINPSTFTSTLQSFGPWQALPQTIPLPVSTVTQDFVVQSTLTAYKENISTTLNVQGVVTGGTLASLGTISAVASISAGANVTATGQIIGGIVCQAPQIIGTTTIKSFGDAFITTGMNVGTFVNVGGSLAVTGASLFIGNVVATSFSTTNASVSTMNVSTINGLPFIPGGGVGQNPTFSTVTVGQAIQTSSFQATQARMSTLDVSSINANSIYTTKLNVNLIDATLINAVAGVYTTGSNTLNIGASGVTVPNGQIIAATAQISSIIASGNVIAKTISTQGLFVSSVNGQQYPPAFLPIVTGNLTVTGTLTANAVIGTASLETSGSVTAAGNIGASGDIVGKNIQGLSLVSQSYIYGSNAVIGGITLGPGGVENAILISASNINVSTINGGVYPPVQAQFSTTIGNFIVPAPFVLQANTISTTTNIKAGGTIQANTLTAITGAFSGTVTANGVQCIAGNMLVSGGTLTVTGGLTTLEATTLTGSLNAGAGIITPSITATTANVVTGNITTANIGTLNCSGVAALNVVTATSYTAPTASISSITNVSTINGAVYPPPSGGGAISTFNILQTSTLKAGNISSGQITANTISSVGNIATGGSLNVLGGSVNCGAITCTGSISANFGDIASKTIHAITSVTAASGTIGGTILGPSGVINASALTLSQTLYASTITTNSFQASNITAPSINTSTLNVDFINILGSGSNNTIQVGSDTIFKGLLINDGYSYLSSIVVSGVIGGSNGASVKFITPLAGVGGNSVLFTSDVQISSLNGLITTGLNVQNGANITGLAVQGGANMGGGTNINQGLTVNSGNFLVKVGLTTMNGLVTMNGGALITGGTTMNGGATVNGLTTMNGGAMIYSGATIIGPTYIPGPLYINSIAPSTITNNREFNTGLNALSAGYQPTIGNYQNSAQSLGSDPTNPYIAQRITGATLNTSFYTISSLPSGGTLSIPGLLLWSVAPAYIKVYAYSGTTTFGGAWDVYGSYNAGSFLLFAKPIFQYGLTLQEPYAPVPCRLPLIIKNTGGGTALDLTVSWVIFPLTN